MMTQVERFGLQEVKWLTKNISAVSSWSKKVPRVAAYLRSAAKDEEYIADQLAKIQRHLEDCGWELSCIYSGNGFSGRFHRRPALLRLQQDIRDEQVDLVVVCNVARLFRDLPGLRNFMRLLQEQQVRVVYLR